MLKSEMLLKKCTKEQANAATMRMINTSHFINQYATDEKQVQDWFNNYDENFCKIIEDILK